MVTVLGWYNQCNIGDDAFQDAFAQALRAAAVPGRLDFEAERVPAGVPVILGGGDVIRPYYLDKVAAGQLLIPIGVGLGYESEIDLLRGKAVPFVVARNPRDIGLLRAAGLRAVYCPDLTFMLDDAMPVAVPAPPGRKTLCVLLSSEVTPTFENRSAATAAYYDYFKWELAAILDNLAEFYDIHFVPFSTLNSIDDRQVNSEVFRRMAQRAAVTLHPEQPSVATARRLLAGFDLVVSMKYHGILFAVQAGVPFINIAETRKTQMFCADNGFAHLSVPAFSLERTRFFDMLKVAEEPATRQAIAVRAAGLKAETRRLLPGLLRDALALAS